MNSTVTNPASSLHEEAQAARALIDLLQKEQAQLVAADIEGLTALTEEKTKVVAQLSDLAARRHKALAAAGFAPQEASMQAWLQTASAAGAAQAWQELLELARTGKELNRINGMLINKHLVRNQQALNILQAVPKENSFYGPNGQSTSNTSARGLVIG